eukprot:gene8945-12782_t
MGKEVSGLANPAMGVVRFVRVRVMPLRRGLGPAPGFRPGQMEKRVLARWKGRLLGTVRRLVNFRDTKDIINLNSELSLHLRMETAGSLPGQKKKTDEDSDDDVDAPSRNHLPASQLKRQYDGVIRVALVVQNLLDDIATAFERFGTLMQWKDPVATMWIAFNLLDDIAAAFERFGTLMQLKDPVAAMIFMAVCSAISIAFYLLGMSVLLAIVGAFVLRPPQFRDPEPPAPLAFFSRLPAFRNVKLPSHKSPSNNGRTEN